MNVVLLTLWCHCKKRKLNKPYKIVSMDFIKKEKKLTFSTEYEYILRWSYDKLLSVIWF